MKLKDLYYMVLGWTLLLLSPSCLEDPEGDGELHNAKAPEVETVTSQIARTATTVTLGGRVIRENGRAVYERGFLYGEKSPLSYESASKWVDEGSGKGDFSGTITNLKDSTGYYFCAYAVNGDGKEGRTLGEEVHVITISGLGIVRTLSVKEIHATTADGTGQIEVPGEGKILHRGFYLKTVADASLDSTVYVESESSEFTHRLTNLRPETTYSLQAFVENQFGVFTGAEQTFTTISGKPSVAETLEMQVDFTSVQLKARLLDSGDADIESLGFYWGDQEHPAQTGQLLEGAGLDPDRTFSQTLTDLVSGKKYFVVAFAKNSFGSSFSHDTLFFTKSDEPVVNLAQCQLNQQTGTLTLKGKLESQGISEVTQVGFCYSTTANPDVETGTCLTARIDKDGQFETSVSLRGGYTYYVRAFATNSKTSGYSVESQVQTPDIFTTRVVASDYKKVAGTVASFTYGNRCYLLGGDDSDGTSDELWMYSSNSNSLEMLPSAKYPAGGRKLQAAACSPWGTACVYGGYADNEAKKEFYMFSASDNRWISYIVPETGPDSLYSAVACLSSNGFYMIGGMDKYNTPTDDVWRFTLNNWTRLSTFPQAQAGGIALFVNDVVYAGMGNTGNGDDKKLWASSDFREWIEVATLEDSGNMQIRGGAVLGKTIYVVDAEGQIWSYAVDSMTNTWRKRSKLPSSVARDIHTMFVLDGVIYVGFGAGVLVSYNPVWDN